MMTTSASSGVVGSTVTIKENGGDFFGKVKSESTCFADRTVSVFKQRPGKDKKIASDTSGDDGAWSTGNTGQNKGRFYAKVRKSVGCSKARSKTIEL